MIKGLFSKKSIEEAEEHHPIFELPDEGRQPSVDEKRRLVSNQNTIQTIDGQLNRTSSTGCLTCCKGCGICCVIILVILIVALIIGAITIAIEGYGTYKAYQTVKGLYTEATSDNPDYLKVAKGVYSFY